MSRGVSTHEQERNFSSRATIKIEKTARSCSTRKRKPGKQRAGSRKAAEEQKAAGKAGKRAKAN